MALVVALIGVSLAHASEASAQCPRNPTGETAVGVKNSSSYFLRFYIDGKDVGGVPAGDRSVDHNVSPGEHQLRVEAMIGGEVRRLDRRVDVSLGRVCTWEITDT